MCIRDSCQVDTAFEQMKETKRNFGKIDKRQGYHIILSFKENELNPDTAFEITQKFVEEYLGKSYEAVFVVHDLSLIHILLIWTGQIKKVAAAWR